MQYRKLGHTGFDVSVVGFGSWQIGGGRWQSASETETIELLKEANYRGINIFDVAVVYGQYLDGQKNLQSRSLDYLGKAFKNTREKVIYCLKIGQIDEYSHRHDYSPKHLIKQFQGALNKLNTDFIDICLIHAPSFECVKEGKAINVLHTLQALGYVKAIGYSFEAEPEHAMEAIKQPIDVLMLQYNLLETGCQLAIQEAYKRGIGILVGGPYKRGYLAGKYQSIDQLPLEDNYWHWNLNLNPKKVEQLLEKVDLLLKHYHTPELLRKACLNFILSEPGATSCIIGHRTLSEVIENIEISSKLTSFLEEQNFFIDEKLECAQV